MSTFLLLLAEAAADSLTERNLRIFRAKFSFVGQSTSLKDIALEHGISRERVRQIICKSIARIQWVGSRSVKRGNLNTPAAMLILLLYRECSELAPQVVLDFCRRELGGNLDDGIYLIVHLLGGNVDDRRRLLDKCRRLASNAMVVHNSIDHTRTQDCQTALSS